MWRGKTSFRLGWSVSRGRPPCRDTVKIRVGRSSWVSRLRSRLSLNGDLVYSLDFASACISRSYTCLSWLAWRVWVTSNVLVNRPRMDDLQTDACLGAHVTHARAERFSSRPGARPHAYFPGFEQKPVSTNSSRHRQKPVANVHSIVSLGLISRSGAWTNDRCQPIAGRRHVKDNNYQPRHVEIRHVTISAARSW